MKIRGLLLCFVFLLLQSMGYGQAYDKGWIIGNGTMIKLIVNPTTLDTASFYWGTAATHTSLASSNVSDSLGNILFYCNGVNVGNGIGQIMDNGDNLPDAMFYNAFVGGFTERQTNLILPKSGNTFYLFYYSESDSLYASNTINEPDRLYYAVIDMDQNGGLGKVISKKNIAYKGLFGDCRLTATRHANGRDWWMVHQGFASNEYFIYLVTPDSIYPPTIQKIGPSSLYAENLGAQSTFSPDGSKFATISSIAPLVIMDFDRCTGVFSNPDSIYIPVDTFRYNGVITTISWHGGVGCSFSANNRFLYLSNVGGIVQYDTRATNITGSATLIGQWDTAGHLSWNGYGFDQLYLLPNGQIIIEDVQGGGSNFHLIDSPNMAGSGCNFILNGLPTNTLNANALPNMINYRLGRLLGSACDTLTGINELASSNQDRIKIYPNPGDDHITISLGQYHSDAKLYIYDAIGREVYSDRYMYLDRDIDISALPVGIYQVSVCAADGVLMSRFVKE